jgi:hypothetical protein
LKEASGYTPPWVQTLHELAIHDAQVIDQVLKNGPLTLLSPMQGKLLDVLDRIRTAPPSAPKASAADEVEDYVNGLGRLGTP